MNQNSRTRNVLYNIIGGVGGQIFTSVLQFTCRTVFISFLGVTYLGINGLFSNILSMLSLAELGIGPAIIFSMYKPIAENDEVHIAKLMNFYRTAYRIIAIIVLIVGLLITPFLNFFINGNTDIENLKMIFVLILMNTVVSYLYAYKGSMLTADQKAYIGVIIRNIFAVIQNVAQIIVLLITKNYFLYLIVQIFTTVIANFILSKYVDKKYPFLLKYKYEKIDKDEYKCIMQKVKGMMMHKTGGFVLNSTDNLVISKFVGVVAVGIYSNYMMIMNMIKAYLTQITGGLTASIGNLVASETKEKTEEVFNNLMFIYFWIYSFCFVCFWVIFQPFITMWLGSSYLMSESVLLIILINFYLNGFQDCINSYINVTGLFWETRKKPIVECLINLMTSVFLADKIGLIGVFLGTLVSFICTFWINPIVLYKKYFNKSVIHYFNKFLIYFLITIIMALGIDWVLKQLILEILILELVIRVVVSIILPNLLIGIILMKSSQLTYLKKMLGTVLKRIRRSGR